MKHKEALEQVKNHLESNRENFSKELIEGLEYMLLMSEVYAPMYGGDSKTYREDVKSRLVCNGGDYEFKESQIDANTEYFEKCMGSGLSANKALLFFQQHLDSQLVGIFKKN